MFGNQGQKMKSPRKRFGSLFCYLFSLGSLCARSTSLARDLAFCRALSSGKEVGRTADLLEGSTRGGAQGQGCGHRHREGAARSCREEAAVAAVQAHGQDAGRKEGGV